LVALAGPATALAEGGSPPLFTPSDVEGPASKEDPGALPRGEASTLPLESAQGDRVARAPGLQAQVFFNARLALRDGKPADVLKLWLLRNALVEQGQAPTHDPSFLSALWAALGSLGLCQDGIPTDAKGAGLWPLALHNWALHAAAGRVNEAPSPFESFDVGAQLRLVSLHDVLSAEELNSVSFFPTDCLRASLATLALDGTVPGNLSDRFEEGLLLRKLLAHSLTTLAREQVQGVTTIEARIFDLDLALAELEQRRSRREGVDVEQQARGVGLSAAGAKALGARVAKWPEDSARARFLRRALTWRADEWLQLKRARREFLFSLARPYSKDPPALRRLILEVVDRLIDRRQGDEVEWWLATLEEVGVESHEVLTSGERGKRLLELDPESGFHERATISLQRGVSALQAGERLEALRAFAFAMGHADESRAASATLGLARRWLSFLLAQYETNDELVATLRALVAKPEFNAIVEGLLWRAALKADAESFERLTRVVHRGGSLDDRVARLRLLAHGDPGALVTGLRDALVDEPSHTLRFCLQLLEHLEAEDATVRLANAPMLRLLVRVLDGFGQTAGSAKAQLALAETVVQRSHGVLDALGAFAPPEPARTSSPRLETFAGNVRLAPVDALPWPFAAAEPEAPSAFEPIALVPVEWRGPGGALIFGWRITE
jgi:hypothetical protein